MNRKKLLPAVLAASLLLPGNLAAVFAQSARPAAGSPYVDPDTLHDEEILHVPTGTKLTADEMMAALDSARVIYVGELHDNADAHRVELEVIRRLFEKHKGRIAVGMEMLRAPSDPQLDRWRRHKTPSQEIVSILARDWGPNEYSSYKPILDYVHDHKIPLLGLKPSPETEAQVRSGGKTTGVNSTIPAMDENNPYHRQYYLPFFGVHAGGEATDPAIERMYRMMVLWDEAMADNVAHFLADPANKDKKLVVIAGSGHMQYGFGIPGRAFRRLPHDYKTVIPLVESEPENGIPLMLSDYVWKVPYTKLARVPDPAPRPR